MIRYATVCSGIEAASLAWWPLGLANGLTSKEAKHFAWAAVKCAREA